MTDKVILVVLAAALLHALWNAVVKGSGDKTVSSVVEAYGGSGFRSCAFRDRCVVVG